MINAITETLFNSAMDKVVKEPEYSEVAIKRQTAEEDFFNEIKTNEKLSKLYFKFEEAINEGLVFIGRKCYVCGYKDGIQTVVEAMK
jgi:hypothetical protein